jgi:hypothetical protein
MTKCAGIVNIKIEGFSKRSMPRVKTKIRASHRLHGCPSMNTAICHK